jgi:hypothetical protein
VLVSLEAKAIGALRSSFVCVGPLFSRKLYTPSGFIPITPSLADALHHLRHPQMHRNLWIDALCINQEDIHERGHQVSGMARVYESAEGVLVWLGPDASNIAEGIFSQIKAYHTASNPNTIDDSELVRRTRLTALKVFELSWFSRLWVVQELLLSYEALFCWGDAQINRWDLEYAALYGNIHSWIAYYYKPPVPDLLHYTRNLSCSDPRDRIYGLLGLCDKSDPLSKAVAELLPDYSRSVEELFTDVACLFLHHASSLELLTQVDASFGNDAGLPSWVPDWRLPETSCVFQYLKIAMFNASDSLQPRLTVAGRSTRILSMYGVRLDVLSDSMLHPFGADDMQTMLSAMTVVWIKLISTVPHQSHAFGKLALFRLLDGKITRNILSMSEYYLKGFNIPESGGPGKLSHAVRAMMRSMLQVTDKVEDTEYKYPVCRPYVRRHEWKGRKLFLTPSGLLGIGPRGMEAGDELILLYGQGRQFLGIVRGGHEYYRFVGTAFVPTLYESGFNGALEHWHASDGEVYAGRLRALWEARAQDMERFDIK